MNINRTIIVTADDAPLARSLAAGLAAGGVGMFETPCTVAGAPCFVSSGLIDAAFGVVLADANALYAACQAIIPPANVTLAQCQDLVANSIVVDCDVESAQDTFTRLGVAII